MSEIRKLDGQTHDRDSLDPFAAAEHRAVGITLGGGPRHPMNDAPVDIGDPIFRDAMRCVERRFSGQVARQRRVGDLDDQIDGAARNEPVAR